MNKLKFTDEEGTLFEFFDGQTAIFQAQTSLRQGVKLNISSKCANWDLSGYWSPENETALRDWLNAREMARNGGKS